MGQSASQGECEVFDLPVKLQSVRVQPFPDVQVFVDKQNAKASHAKCSPLVDGKASCADTAALPISAKASSVSVSAKASSLTFADNGVGEAAKATASAAKAAGMARKQTAELGGYLKERGAVAAAERQRFASERARALSRQRSEASNHAVLAPRALSDNGSQLPMIDQVHWSRSTEGLGFGGSPRTPHCARFGKKRSHASLIDTSDSDTSSARDSPAPLDFGLEGGRLSNRVVPRGISFSL